MSFNSYLIEDQNFGIMTSLLHVCIGLAVTLKGGSTMPISFKPVKLG